MCPALKFDMFSGDRQAHAVIPLARQPYVEPAARHDLGRMEHKCPKCGALHWLSERVQKSGSTDLHPLFGMCCQKPRVSRWGVLESTCGFLSSLMDNFAWPYLGQRTAEMSRFFYQRVRRTLGRSTSFTLKSWLTR